MFNRDRLFTWKFAGNFGHSQESQNAISYKLPDNKHGVFGHFIHCIWHTTFDREALLGPSQVVRKWNIRLPPVQIGLFCPGYRNSRFNS